MALIIGRAIAGWGSAGILTGSFVVVSHAVPLHRRPVYSAVVGVMFGVGAIVGPLLGGLFTQDVTWRWWYVMDLERNHKHDLIYSQFLLQPSSGWRDGPQHDFLLQATQERQRE